MSQQLSPEKRQQIVNLLMMLREFIMEERVEIAREKAERLVDDAMKLDD